MFSAFKKVRGPLQAALFLAGLILFYFVLRSAGWENLKTLLPAFWGGGLFLLFIYPFMCLWDVWGWRLLFPDGSSRKVRFGELYAIRLAGEAINNITPFVDIGGEPLKVELTSERFGIPRKDVLSSVVLARTFLLYSEVIFWIMGIALAAPYLVALPAAVYGALYAAIVVFLVLSVVIGWGQHKGIFGALFRWLERLGVAERLVGHLRVPSAEVDRQIRLFYSKKKNAAAASFFLHFLGWAAGAVENYFFFRAIGIPVTWQGAFLWEALFQLIKTASFFIPGNLGAQEAGLVLVAEGLGTSAAGGVGLSLFKRFRMVVWTAAGFAAWGFFEAFLDKKSGSSIIKV